MIRIVEPILTISVGLLILSCGGQEMTRQEPEKVVVVKTSQVKEMSLPTESSYIGTVEPIRRVILSTKVVSWIDEIKVEEGERVVAGAVLVRLRNSALEARLVQARAGVEAAETHLQNAQTNLKRIEVLFADRAATQKELDDSRTAFSAAQAQLEAAKGARSEVEETLEYTNLKATFDGIVTSKLLEAGDLANPGQPILGIEDTRRMKIVAKVPESDVGNLKAGMPVAPYVQSLKVERQDGQGRYEIDKIVPSADPKSRQFDVHVVVDNPAGRLKSGMFARIYTGDRTRRTLVVPEAAVLKRGQLRGLFVVDQDGRAWLRWIRIGTTHKDLIEVLSGLNPGEQVVVDDPARLSDGQNIEVL